MGITCEANLDLLVGLAGLGDLALVVVLVREAARLEGALVLTGLGRPCWCGYGARFRLPSSSLHLFPVQLTNMKLV